ncbi:MAG: hypothetical protein ACXW25_13415 [Rhodospirillales bacterium]
MEWRASPEPDRRAAALRSAWLDRSTDAYGKGFAEDLNHFYSGLNTLAMLTVELALAAALPAVWSERYFEADDATRELQTRTKRAKQLAQAVDLSINAAKTKLERKNKRDVRTAISEADLRCLTVDAPPQVARAYQAALAGAPDFAVDAARGQLLLYRELGVRTANVDAALRIFPAASAAETCETGAIQQILLFTGHMIDALDRAKPRFPAACEEIARQTIRDAVAQEISEPKSACIGIAGGARGGDILFHEVCAELSLKTQLYLALPWEQFIAESVTPAGPGWVERFRALYEQLPKRELSAGKELPQWLRGKPNYDIWQRNNLWMLYNALTLSRKRITLIALWDGQTGDAPGGTEHMLDIARVLD